MTKDINTFHTEVAVIGAGFSGLQAALSLRESGISFMLIEAHHRVGGKSLTTPLTTIDGIVEMGPTWINDKTQPRMYEMVKRYGLGVIKQYLGGLEVIYDANGQAHTYKHGELPPTLPDDQITQLGVITTLLETEAAKFDPERPGCFINNEPPDIPDTSMAEFLSLQGIPEGSISHIYLTVFCRGVFGLETSELGVYFFLDTLKQGHGFRSLAGDDSEGAQFLRIEKGTSTICQQMASELPPESILLDAPVTHIEQRDGGACVVTTESGCTIHCAKVIITVPSHTYHHITFTPPLPPSKHLLASRTLRGHYAKSVLTYATPWWRELGLTGKFNGVGDGPVTTSWELSRPEKGQYSLAVFTTADHYVAHFANSTPEDRKNSIVTHLAKIVGATAGKKIKDAIYNVQEFIEQDWYEKAYIEGAPMAAFGPGDFTRLAPILREVFQNIHFAGTETARVWKGYMEGAIEAGERVAAEIISEMKS
ncbi:hypothetical protein BKA66DRAFT_441451 [Pyrenochaeta sp. MPI-SDFR-AT-0127]|nr:hypothetical protein BKA66DRAFT_441451 [Pyrenochaeta sp. MPI-SDFR-AT-0127]